MKVFSRGNSWAGATQSDVRELAFGELNDALAIARLDPVANVLVIAHLEECRVLGRLTAPLWGFPATGQLESICWAGANLMPVVPSHDPRHLIAFAAQAMSGPRRSSSIVGDAADVAVFWEALSGPWHTAREIRAHQPSMIMTAPAQVPANPAVRFADLDEFDQVFPASVAMFHEEVGVSPLGYGSSMYEQRVRYLIAERRTMIDKAMMETDRSGGAWPLVTFKADFGAVTSEVAQVQGVWVHPDYRGQGRSVPAMATVVNEGLRTLAPIISLYVNDYNARALATYRRVGFEQVGVFASILF